ncbi:MAG TPA: MarR family transcriptional regulator [Candidatus Didemnitutus sp.]|nr:MarR family transcriptional regulator [Candidatus Didemnitutus sp.]
MLNHSKNNHQTVDAADYDNLSAASFAVRTLITIAERRKGIDAARCRLALLHFETATLLHRSLRRALARHKLTDLQFAVLVILFSTEPEPIAASVLAEHATVSRAAVTDALDKLESLQFAIRTRDEFDRRMISVRITPAGQEAVDIAVNDYLRAAEDAAREVRPAAQRTLLAAYLQLLRGLSSPGDKPRHDAPVS